MTAAASAIERHVAIARDAAPLVMARFACRQPVRACLLVSDPGADRSLWMHGTPSAVDHLLNLGCEVFVAELRGCGLSAAAGAPAARGAGDYTTLDVPALVAAARRLCGTPLPLHWIGHRRAVAVALSAAGLDGVVGLDAVPQPGMGSGGGEPAVLLVHGASDARARKDADRVAAMLGTRACARQQGASRRTGLIVDGDAAASPWSAVVRWLDSVAAPVPASGAIAA